ncbi:hypothetical protein NPIL_508331, partial [Nephila pilipes]
DKHELERQSSKKRIYAPNNVKRNEKQTKLARKSGEIDSPRNKTQKSAGKLGGINQRRAKKSPREEAERPERRNRSPGREKQEREQRIRGADPYRGIKVAMDQEAPRRGIKMAMDQEAPFKGGRRNDAEKWNDRIRI